VVALPKESNVSKTGLDSYVHMHYSAKVQKEIEAYKAAGEKTRLRILKLLRLAGEELCVCELVDVLEKPQYTVSKSLTVLRRAELVEERREGKLMMYRLRRSSFNDRLFESLDNISHADPVYETDRRRMIERLALRENGKCVITYQRQEIRKRATKEGNIPRTREQLAPEEV
jgi:ArsR family transcriptional regulator